MSWTVEIVGMSGIESWIVSDLPPHPADQDRAVAEHFPDVVLECESRRGSRLRYIARPPGAHRRLRGPELSLVAASGPDAGHVVPFPRGGTTVGRGGSRWRLADPTAPARPVALTASSSGLCVDDDGPSPWQNASPVAVGTTDIVVARGPGEPLPPAAVPPTARVDTSGAPAPMSLVLPAVMAVGPLLLGVVLAVSTGRAFFLLFGLLSVVAVGTMLGLQRRSRTLFRRRLHARVDAVIEERERSALTPLSLTRACRSSSADRFALQADAAAEDRGTTFLPPVLHWGSGIGELPVDDPVRQERWRPDTVRRQPVLSRPAPGAAVRVAGAGPEHDGVLRWLVVQLLLQASRRGLGFAVCSADTGLLWQTGPGAAGVLLTLPSGRIVAPLQRAWSRRCPAGSATAVPSSGERWAEVTVVEGAVRASDGEDLIDLSDGSARLGAEGQDLEDLHACEVSVRTACWWVEEIASDVAAAAPGLRRGTAPTPLRVPTAPGVRAAVEELVTPLVGPDEGGHAQVDLDFVADGPHVLVAGTTGSGKSDLLLGMLTGLCATHPPSEVALVLLDFKGGASFSCLEQLPHTMSVETNHVASASLRALDAVGAELRRREELFAAHRVSDYPEFRRRVPGMALPRLVVAVDELRVLIDEHPEASEVLRRLAATGRSLGFHLVLATQRATGSVSADIRSNVGSVLCLRTATEQESWDLTGSARAARIPSDQPGTVVHVGQGREPRTFRAATWVRSDAARRWVRRGAAEIQQVAPTLWSEVVAELAALAEGAALPVPDPILSPPLPESWTPQASGAVPLALVDDTASGRHRRLDAGEGPEASTAWLIEPGGGRDLLIARLRQDLIGTGEHVLHLDGTGTPESERDGTPHDVPRRWRVLTPDGPQEPVEAVLESVAALAETGGTLLVSGWGAWASLRCPRSYRGLEELLVHHLGTDGSRGIRVAAVGGRELASSRLVAQLPRRLYVPAGTTPEQRMMWPRLTEVLHLPGRAVLIDADHPEPGAPAQLPFPPP